MRLCRRTNNKFQLKWFRWSLGICLLLYSTLFALVKVYGIPPMSDDQGAARTTRVEHEKNNSEREHRWEPKENIIDYLHKLHKSKATGAVPGEDSGTEIIRPFLTVEEVFHKADSNGDNYLDSDEISSWIHLKTQEHIHRAIVDNYKTFVAIDVRPKNGFVSWDEYYAYFLRKNGYNESSYTQDDRDRNLERSMSRKMREAIMRDRAAFSESAKTDSDHLGLDEFLSFTHPESSYSTIIYLVDEIYKKFDRDGDEILTEEEFSTLLTDDDYERQETVNQEEEEERRKEFRNMVDLNQDGKATRKELLTYVDPKNPRHAKEEADILVDLADADKDGRLSLLEIFNKMDLFLGSKMIDTARSFHDEL